MIPAFDRRSLITRLVGLSLLLLLFVQLAGFFVVRDSIARNARMQIAREFDTGEKVWLRPVSYTHLTLPTNREV